MTYRAQRAILLHILLILTLCQSIAEAKNYVILSMTKDGLRELRLAFRGRLILQTSLASVESSDSLVFSRATDGIRLVETVIRYGAIDDCIVSSSYDDVRAFSSEFSDVSSGKLLDTEGDIMDVYLGIKNVTDKVFLSRHSNIDDQTTFNDSAASVMSEDVLQEHASSKTNVSSLKHIPKFKLSAKIPSANNSPFMHILKPYLQIRKNVRECRLFHEKATESLEMLWMLDQQVHLEGQSTLADYLNRTDNQTLHRLQPHRQHRIRHHHHHRHRLDHHFESYKPIKEQEEVGQRETLTSSNHSSLSTSISSNHSSLSSSTDRADGDHIHTILSTTGPDSKSETFNVDRSGTESAAENPNFQSPLYKNSSSFLSSLSLTRIPDNTKTANQSYRISDDNLSLNGSKSVAEDKVNNGNYQNIVYNNGSVQFTGAEAELPIGSNESRDSHSRSKRDLLTGWMIFPGTKWCGDGDIAEHKKDMGYHVELDKCCRRHDLCPLVIPRLSWKYGMFNYRLHTLSHCRCDRKFRKCLKASTSPLAHLIGQIYFNVVGPHCFKFAQKPTCVQRFWWGGCKEWASSKVALSKKQRRFK